MLCAISMRTENAMTGRRYYNDQKCNILIVIDSLGTGGAERSVQDLSTEFIRNGHQVVVLVIRDNIEMQLDASVVVEVLGFISHRGLPKYSVNAARLKRRV